ncbi:MAG: hypothetical protein KDB28_07285 [Tetrasphaera sp.]|nr:hypothetical protein [Actinomycetota bacterium]MCB1301050.1 hypothetical protein [Tetrasphaera sp.]HPF81389.1 hypothetical protein [Tetrasphaera australiensis]HRW02660.1 hypothetical protein [Tetrasphaera sp.]
MVELITWIVLALAVVLGIAWYLSYSAARLDRLHAKVEGALSALDANLVRRAEASIELANSGVLDPASALLLASAASEALERETSHALPDDPLDGQHFGDREDVETDLTEALAATLTEDVRAHIEASDGPAADELDRLVAAGRRVQFARNFHNQAVRDVQRVRNKRVVRWFRLAGYAELPRPVEFADTVPGDR